MFKFKNSINKKKTIIYTVPDDFDATIYKKRYNLENVFNDKPLNKLYKYYTQHKSSHGLDNEYYRLYYNIPDDFNLDIFKDVYPDLVNKSDTEIFKILNNNRFLLNDVYYRVYYNIPKYFDIITFKNHFKNYDLENKTNLEIYKFYNEHSKLIYFDREYFNTLKKNNIISFSVSDINLLKNNSNSLCEYKDMTLKEEEKQVEEKQVEEKQVEEKQVEEKQVEEKQEQFENIKELEENIKKKYKKKIIRNTYKIIFLKYFDDEIYKKLLNYINKNYESFIFVYTYKNMLKNTYFFTKMKIFPRNSFNIKLIDNDIINEDLIKSKIIELTKLNQDIKIL